MKNNLLKFTLLIIITLASLQHLVAKTPNEGSCVPPAAPVNTTPTLNLTICSGKFTTLTVSGSGTIGWYSAASGGVYLGGGSSFITPALTAGITYYAQDSTCDVSTTRTAISVTVNSLPNVIASSSNTTLCAGSSASLAASNAATYVWNPGVLSGSFVTVTPSSFTTYTVTGTDGNGCTNSSTLSITVFPLPTVGTSVTSSTICAGSSTTINGTGATFYNWQPGSLSGSILTLSPAATTTYTVTGVNMSTLCTNTATRTITVNPAPIVNASASLNTVCSGSPTTLSATGGSTYIWNPGSISGANPTVTPAVTTTYTVTGTNSANGCTSKSTVTITVNALPGIAATANPASICVGASTTLNGTGGISYTWESGSLSGSSVSVTPATSTTYTVTGTNANSCSNTSTVIVNVNPLPPVGTSTGLGSICLGSSTNITGTGANTYTWQPGALSGTTINVSPLTAITYTVTGTNTTTGCSNTSTRTIDVNTNPVVNVTASLNTVCAGSPTTLSATGADTYTWNPGAVSGVSVIVTPLVSTTYTVTGTNGSTGCTNTSTKLITVNVLPNVVTSATNPTICSGGSTTITGNGANTYTWEPGAFTTNAITVSPLVTTIYTVTGTSSTTGCSKTAIRNINVNALPPTSVTASATTLCPGSTTSLTASGANTYFWTPIGLSGSSITVSPSITTTYTVTGTSTAGCIKTSSITITVNAVSNVNTSTSANSICPGNTVTITALGSASYTWQPGSLVGTTVTVSPTTTTTYTVTGTNALGCTKTATRTITVLSCGSVLNLKVFIEDYYIGGGAMRPVLMNQTVPGATSTQTDTIIAELRSTVTPTVIAHSLKTVLNTNGTAVCNFPISGTYYLVVKHRNGLQTWSASPITLSTVPLTYDFSTASSKAYGSNQSEVESGVWAIYSGEINADENIDLLDQALVDFDISNFEFGYKATDLNGDGNVDLLDSPTLEANINSFIFSLHP